mgnify:CR=1 FL=1
MLKTYIPESMRCYLFAVLLVFLSTTAGSAQRLFPVKQGQRWGLIDAQGKMQVSPRYEAIGAFKQFGYASMQRNGGVGLLNQRGEEVVAPRYQDIKILDSLLIAVLEEEAWRVINLSGEQILAAGYDQVEVWDGPFLAYAKNGKWGVLRKDGTTVLPLAYDNIDYLPRDSCFFLYQDDQMGVAALTGDVIFPPRAQRIKAAGTHGFLVKEEQRWGLIDRRGKRLFPARYLSYEFLSPYYLKLYAVNGIAIYSFLCDQSIISDRTDDYFALTHQYLLTREGAHVGVIDWCGQPILSNRYQEIQSFRDNWFRVRTPDGWGIVAAGDSISVPTQYDYIAPLTNNLALVRQAGQMGLINQFGEEVLAPVYDRLEQSGRRVRAYRLSGESTGESVRLFSFDSSGRLQASQQLQQHFTVRVSGPAVIAPTGMPAPESFAEQTGKEWFYDSREDRWGLRQTNTGQVLLQPAFTLIRPVPNTTLALVGLPKATPLEMERTSFRFDRIFGIVDQELGALVTEMKFVHVYIQDFSQGQTVARCILADGTFGLMNTRGELIEESFAYIGPFRNGRARASRQGTFSAGMQPRDALGPLSGFLDSLLAPCIMTDYTRYDELFRRQASTTCLDCTWGYIDEKGKMVIPDRYEFVRDMENEIGLVRQSGKWGAIHADGRTLIPCRYDDIRFLEHTGNSILKVYIEKPKYGLIDTLGQLAIRATYDQIGALSEGRLAVMHDDMWGYTNLEGQEIISCRFDEVRPFSEGVAAVRLGGKWGFIDRMGQVVIDFTYEACGSFHHQLAWVTTTDQRTGYIDTEGNLHIPAQYDEATDFFRGVARVRQGDAWGLIDTRGKYIMEPHYRSIERFYEEGVAIVRYGRTGEKYGLIDLQGNLLTKRAYEDIEAFSEGLAVAKIKGAYGYVDLSGRMVIPAQYSRAEAFSEGRAAVYLNGSCGYLDRRGDRQSEFSFSRCNPYADGRAVVYRGLRRAGLLNLQGDLLIEPSVDRLLNFSEGRGLVRQGKYRFYFISEEADIHHGYYEKASEFTHGVAVVRINNKWGVINRRGIALIPPKYSKISSFQDGYARVKVEGFSGLTNAQGQPIVSPDFESISYAGDGVFRVEQGDKVGYFNQQGDWIWHLSN